MEVVKIGGSVLKSRQGFRSFLDIIAGISTPTLVIISAFDKATQLLANIASVAVKGHKAKAFALLHDFFDEHKRFAQLILTDQNDIIQLLETFEKEKNSLSEIIEGVVITKELSPRVKDIILSYGEKLALATICCFFNKRQIAYETIDAGDIIVTDEHFGRAVPLEKETAKNVNKILLPALKENRLVIMQGFVAKSKSGETTTMGIESSNLTAALMAKILNLKRITYWTDVCGIRNFDPRLVDRTKLIPTLNYDDAFLYGKAGLKLIYPGMIDFVKDSGIELVYKSPFCDFEEQTVIKNTRSYTEPVIISSPDMVLNRVIAKSEAEIRQTMTILRHLIDTKVSTFNYFKIKDNEFVFISSEYDNFEKEFKGLNYTRETNMSIITLFNISFEKYAALIIRHRKQGNSFPGLVKFIDFNDDFIVLGIKQRFTRSVLQFFNNHLNVLT